MTIPRDETRTPGNRRSRASLAGICSFCFVCLVYSFLFAASPTGQGPRSAFLRTGPIPGVRFSSGLTVCDEELRNGRWVSRYWDSSGQIIADIQIDAQRPQMDRLPVDAFKLEMEGQELSGTWNWIGSNTSEVQNREGLLVTVELESGARPIRVKVQTLLSGGPVMVRWLEIQNTGQRPTAISNVSPWAGQLWHTPDFAEKLQPGSEDVFDVGYAQFSKWGYEGAWRFDPVINETKIIAGKRGKSGWGHPTFFARNNATGEWFVGSLAWSANWKIRVTSKVDRSPVDRSDSVDRPVNEARLFFDSFRHAIYAYDYSAEAGTITNRRTFVQTSPEGGLPDGLTVDTEGFVWSAYCGGWRVVRYTPEGKVDREYRLPVANPTSCAFGGRRYITSASLGLSEEEKRQYPQSGDLFCLRAGITGMDEPRFAG